MNPGQASRPHVRQKPRIWLRTSRPMPLVLKDTSSGGWEEERFMVRVKTEVEGHSGPERPSEGMCQNVSLLQDEMGFN